MVLDPHVIAAQVVDLNDLTFGQVTDFLAAVSGLLPDVQVVKVRSESGKALAGRWVNLVDNYQTTAASGLCCH